jgi:hypothetical protein
MKDQSSTYLSNFVAGIAPASYATPALRFTRIGRFLLKEFMLVMIWTVIAIRPAGATSFKLIFDASTAGAPAGFFTAFTDVVQFYQATLSTRLRSILLWVGGRLMRLLCDPAILDKA